MDTYQEAVDLMAATPAALRALVAATSPETLRRRPAAEAWSVQEVLNHLLHVETAVIGERVRRMIEEDEPVLPPASPPSPASDPETTLDRFQRARTANLAFLRELTPAQRDRTGRHPRHGQLTVRQHVVEWAYHDLDHLRQILAAIQSPLYSEIGPFQAIYPKPA